MESAYFRISLPEKGIFPLLSLFQVWNSRAFPRRVRFPCTLIGRLTRWRRSGMFFIRFPTFWCKHVAVALLSLFILFNLWVVTAQEKPKILEIHFQSRKRPLLCRMFEPTFSFLQSDDTGNTLFANQDFSLFSFQISDFPDLSSFPSCQLISCSNKKGKRNCTRMQEQLTPYYVRD